MLTARSVTIRSRCFYRPSLYRQAVVRSYSNKLTAGSPVTTYGTNPIVRYTDNHEWVALHKDNTAFIGITKYAADALGETTFVEVDEDTTDVAPGDAIGTVESVKSASDVYSPISGTFIEANSELAENTAWVNEDPLGKAWFAKITATNPEEMDGLLDYDKYEEFLKEH